jgi:hypothetical protein
MLSVQPWGESGSLSLGGYNLVVRCKGQIRRHVRLVGLPDCLLAGDVVAALLKSELCLTFVQCHNTFQLCGLRNSGSLEAVIHGDPHIIHDLIHQGLDVAGFHRHVSFHVLHSLFCLQRRHN